MKRWDRTRLLLMCTAVLLLSYLVGSNVYTQIRANNEAGAKVQAQQQAAENAQDAKAVADPLAELCRDPAVAARVGDACKIAAEVRRDPEQAIQPVGPTRAQISAAVTEYLAAHPPPAGQAATLDQITAAVAGYLIAHPPQPGRAPTTDEIRIAVASYLADHPAPAGQNGTNGTNGQDGSPGRPPTDDEIDAAVARYFEAHPPPPGPEGPTGPRGEPGRGVRRAYVDDCRWYVTYTDGSTEDAGNACSSVLLPPSSSDSGLLPTPTR